MIQFMIIQYDSIYISQFYFKLKAKHKYRYNLRTKFLARIGDQDSFQRVLQINSNASDQFNNYQRVSTSMIAPDQEAFHFSRKTIILLKSLFFKKMIVVVFIKATWYILYTWYKPYSWYILYRQYIPYSWYIPYTQYLCYKNCCQISKLISSFRFVLNIIINRLIEVEKSRYSLSCYNYLKESHFII